MTVTGSVIREQGVTFAVVLVKEHVVNNRSEGERMIQACAPLFPGMPIVLAAQDYKGRFTYFGRSDISKFLASIDAARIPWKEYTFSD